MVEPNDSGNVELSKSIDASVASRQASPIVYAMNASVYCWHSHTLDMGLWGGRTKLHVMPRERSIDIDDPLDFKIVELLMLQRSLSS